VLDCLGEEGLEERDGGTKGFYLVFDLLGGLRGGGRREGEGCCPGQWCVEEA